MLQNVNVLVVYHVALSPHSLTTCLSRIGPINGVNESGELSVFFNVMRWQPVFKV